MPTKGVEKVEKPQGVVAVTFYSKQTLGKELGFYNGILNEENKADVLRLKEGLKAAAETRGEMPPQVEITLYLVPEWKNGQKHDSTEYLDAKKKMIQEAQNLYGMGVIIKDFLDSHVSPEELAFLDSCESMGSVADIVKTRTIVENKGRPCLQTDSNVTWANNDFDKLYELTFASNKDAFNTSRCSEVYVSAHNKLVFTSSDSALPDIFDKQLVEYSKNYNTDPWHKDAACNGVYDIAFCEGMAQHGLTYRVRVDDKWNPGKTFDFYPAKLDDERYKLMPTVVPCQRESWRAGPNVPPPDPVVQELTGQLMVEGVGKKSTLEVNINDVQYGYFHFKSLVRVFINIPSWHAEEGKNKYAEETGDLFEGAENARNSFVCKQDTKLYVEIFATYYNKVKTEYEAGNFQSTRNPLELLANLIPNTVAGNKLSQELFHCSVQELHENPVREASMPPKNDPDHHRRFEVPVLPTYQQQKLQEEISQTQLYREQVQQIKGKEEPELTDDNLNSRKNCS
jgi:hypothetical protein